MRAPSIRSFIRLRQRKQRRLAAARWPDEGGDGARRKFQIHVMENLIGAVSKIEIFDLMMLALDRSGLGAVVLLGMCVADWFWHFD